MCVEWKGDGLPRKKKNPYEVEDMSKSLATFYQLYLLTLFGKQ